MISVMLNKTQRRHVLTTLEELAEALAEHNHKWNKDIRDQYQEAIRLLWGKGTEIGKRRKKEVLK